MVQDRIGQDRIGQDGTQGRDVELDNRYIWYKKFSGGWVVQKVIIVSVRVLHVDTQVYR